MKEALLLKEVGVQTSLWELQFSIVSLDISFKRFTTLLEAKQTAEKMH